MIQWYHDTIQNLVSFVTGFYIWHSFRWHLFIWGMQFAKITIGEDSVRNMETPSNYKQISDSIISLQMFFLNETEIRKSTHQDVY